MLQHSWTGKQFYKRFRKGQATVIICPKCNAQKEDGAGFCDQCGNNLVGLSAAPSFQSAPAVMTSPGSGNTCPSCGAAVIPGEAFCDNCGAAISSGPSNSVGVAPPPPVVQPVVNPVGVMPQGQPTFAPAPAASAGRIEFSNGQSVTLSGKNSYLIGREDPVSGIFPEVDTTPSGGEEAGVSRRHAEIIQQGAQWFVQALNTTNPTFVNQQKVAPNTRLPLNPGDQIRLGKWVATFQAG